MQDLAQEVLTQAMKRDSAASSPQLRSVVFHSGPVRKGVLLVKYAHLRKRGRMESSDDEGEVNQEDETILASYGQFRIRRQEDPLRTFALEYGTMNTWSIHGRVYEQEQVESWKKLATFHNAEMALKCLARNPGGNGIALYNGNEEVAYFGEDAMTALQVFQDMV